MNVNKALEEAIKSSGVSKYAIGQKLGRSRNYIYNLFQRDAIPTFATVASIADACGFDVTLTSRDGEHTIIIDPPTE